MARLYRGKDKIQKPEFEKIILQTLLNIIVTIYMLLILVVLPFYNKDGYSHIGTDKSEFFRHYGARAGLFALVLFGIYLFVQMFMGKGKNLWKETVEKWSATDSFALFFFISVLISHALSNYRETAWLGAFGWYMGTLAQTILILSYFFISRFWDANWIIPSLVIPVSLVVFGLGILNRFGIRPIDMKVESTMYISTIGNINWYCGYLVIILFFAMGFYIFDNKVLDKFWKRLILLLYLGVGILAIVTQGSDSGIFALAMMLVVMFFLAGKDKAWQFHFATVLFELAAESFVMWILRRKGLFQAYLSVEYKGANILTNSVVSLLLLCVSIFLLAAAFGRMKGWWKGKAMDSLPQLTAMAAVTVVVVFATFVTVNTLRGGIPGEKLGIKRKDAVFFDEKWGSNRGTTWKAGFLCFAEQDFLHKLVGVGPDSMMEYIYSDGSEELLELVARIFGQSKLTNAHNEWITILVDEGILGLIGFAGMFCTAVFRFSGKRGKLGLIAAFGMGILAYMFNNVFSFQQSMCTPTVFVFLGMGEAWMRKSADHNKKEPPNGNSL